VRKIRLVSGKLLHISCGHADINHKVPMNGCGPKRNGTNTKLTCSSLQWHGHSVLACLCVLVYIILLLIGCLANVIKNAFFSCILTYLADLSELRGLCEFSLVFIWFNVLIYLARWSILLASLVLTPGYSWVDGHAKAIYTHTHLAWLFSAYAERE
jgi:hypothetical protein